MKHLLWLDLETTGLDPNKDSILEIALVETDQDLNMVATFSRVLYYPETLQPALPEHVLAMHTQNQLLDECAATANTMPLVEAEVSAWAEEHQIKNPRPMAGTNPHFDRAFLRRHFPRLEQQLFHYRSFDMNTLRLLLDAPRPAQGPGHAHRALDDLRRDIEQLRVIKRDLNL